MNWEEVLIEWIKDDPYIIEVLKAVESLQLPDCWVCAGLIRNKVWDVIHHMQTTVNDIDVIYFDSSDLSIKSEKNFESSLTYIMPHQPWSVKNQARMHTKNNLTPFSSSFDGVSYFPETPTAIAVKMANDQIEVMAPYGLHDLFNCIVKPTPPYQASSKLYTVYKKRMESKKWQTIWLNLHIELPK